MKGCQDGRGRNLRVSGSVDSFDRNARERISILMWCEIRSHSNVLEVSLDYLPCEARSLGFSSESSQMLSRPGTGLVRGDKVCTRNHVRPSGNSVTICVGRISESEDRSGWDRLDEAGTKNRGRESH
jgi:hypothetical protein